MPYVKLDAGILDSTLWVEDAVTCKVFITILAMCDADGLCASTAPGIARRANVSLVDARHAIGILESPDADSRSLDDDGRRIKRVDGGYQVVNYTKYRNKDHTAAERKRRQREREQNQSHNELSRVTNVTVTEAEAEAEVKRKDLGDKPPRKTFVPPTLEEVSAYCLERRNSVNPAKWHNHYTANGWMVGKNRMKDWRAAVRTWEEGGRRGHDGNPFAGMVNRQ